VRLSKAHPLPDSPPFSLRSQNVEQSQKASVQLSRLKVYRCHLHIASGVCHRTGVRRTGVRVTLVTILRV
jgi:hypothetical protein